MKNKLVVQSIVMLLLIVSIPIQTLSQQLEVDSLPYQDSYRKIRVYIPSPAERLTNQKVIYMLDGQNLFDPKTSYAGEWEVDEAIEQLKDQQKPIVIGIDHGNDKRIDELTPYSHEKYGGGKADRFLEFIINQVMLFVEQKYHIEHKREDTYIAGSLLGGLFAHYAILSKPEVFSAAGIFSPSYWFSDLIYGMTEKAEINHPILLYLSAGNAESENLVEEMKSMKSILDTKKSISTTIEIIPGAEHNEKQWRESFPDFLKAINL